MRTSKCRRNLPAAPGSSWIWWGYGGVRRYCRSVQIRQINVVVWPAGDIEGLDYLTIVRAPQTYRLNLSAQKGSARITLRLRRDLRSEQASEVANWIDRLRGDADVPGGRCGKASGAYDEGVTQGQT
jgi:hypothetical protein